MSSSPSSSSSSVEAAAGQQHFRDVPLAIEVSLGHGAIPLRVLVALAPGVVVPLKASAGSDLQVRANGVLVAVGEVVIIEDTIGVRVTHVASLTGEPVV
jgi:flagellar motor switch protein FliN/FliY